MYNFYWPTSTYSEVLNLQYATRVLSFVCFLSKGKAVRNIYHYGIAAFRGFLFNIYWVVSNSHCPCNF